jgi:hypothetical protein
MLVEMRMKHSIEKVVAVQRQDAISAKKSQKNRLRGVIV